MPSPCHSLRFVYELTCCVNLDKLLSLSGPISFIDNEAGRWVLFPAPPLFLCGFLSFWRQHSPLKLLSQAETDSPSPLPLSDLLLYSWVGVLHVLCLVVFLTSQWKMLRGQEDLSRSTPCPARARARSPGPSSALILGHLLPQLWKTVPRREWPLPQLSPPLFIRVSFTHPRHESPILHVFYCKKGELKELLLIAFIS